MEKIKQALEKARDEQMKLKGQQLDPSTEKPVIKATEKISYSDTRTISLDEKLLKSKRIITQSENTEVDAAYRMLRTQVLQSLLANDWNSVAITSPGIGEGKSLTAVNLALSLAREVNFTVLLVDFDLKRPSLAGMFGIEAQSGISDFILKDKALKEILIHPDVERLVLLPGNESLRNSSEILKSTKMTQLVEELKSRYPSRIIIFDLPPLLATDDALSFAPFVESLLLVIEEGKTSEQDLIRCEEMLKNTNIIGTVLNKSTEKPSNTTY